MESATCIVAVAHKGKVWFGGDSAATDATGERNIVTNKKVFSLTDNRKNSWLFGFTGAYRFAQLLQYELKIPGISKEDEVDLLAFLVRKFIPALHTCLQDHSFEQTDKGRALGGTCLVSVKGRIFMIGNQYSIQQSIKPYNAIGCGAPTALGSLFSTESLPPEKRIHLALAASEQFNTGVAGPFTIIHS